MELDYTQNVITSNAQQDERMQTGKALSNPKTSKYLPSYQWHLWYNKWNVLVKANNKSITSYAHIPSMRQEVEYHNGCIGLFAKAYQNSVCTTTSNIYNYTRKPQNELSLYLSLKHNFSHLFVRIIFYSRISFCIYSILLAFIDRLVLSVTLR